MSNLSELLPTGGGQNAVDFVASGTLSSGQTVALKTDGTVEAVSASANPSVVGSAVVFDTSTTSYIASAFDSNLNKVVIAYRDENNSNYGTAIVGTVSGTTISFGSAVVFNASDAREIGITFDSNENKIVIVYRDNGNSGYGTAIVGTVSGTSISFGSEVVFESAITLRCTAVFDTVNNKVLIAYRDFGNSNYGTAIVGTVSGTSISFGSAVVFAAGNTNDISMAFDSNVSKVVVAYRDDSNSLYGTAIVATVSGTSVSFGTAAIFDSSAVEQNTIAFDSTANKVVIAYRAIGASSYGTAVVGTVSGTSISFGSTVVFNSVDTYFLSSIYSITSNKIVISYGQYGAPRNGYSIEGTISGTSISFLDPVIFISGTTFYISSVLDSNSNVVSIAVGSNGTESKSVIFQPPSSNYADFIGITAGAISDTATGAVNVYGGINEAQTGLTIGSDYYVQNDGSISTTASAVKIGQAISATTINMMDLT